MSTRSGRKIHTSESENIDNNSVLQTVRKTRSKSQKENCDEVATIKKKIYLRRPSEDETECSIDQTEVSAKSARKSRRQTLKDLNMVSIDSELTNYKNSMRQSRRIRKDDVDVVNVLTEEVVTSKEKKKPKKKKAVAANFENEVEAIVVQKKKKTKKKNKNSNSFLVEDLVNGEGNIRFNKSNASVDSFHSAAGSPTNDTSVNQDNDNSSEIKGSRSRSTYNSTENENVMKKKIKKTKKEKATRISILKKSFEFSDNNIDAGKVVNETTFNEKPSEVLKKKSKKKKTKENYFSNLINTDPFGIMHDDIGTSEHLFQEDSRIQNKIRGSKKSDEVNIASSDFITDTPQGMEIIDGDEDESTPCNSAKKIRRSSCRISTINKVDTSGTAMNASYSKRDLGTDRTTCIQESKLSDGRNTMYDKVNLSDTNINTLDKHDSLNGHAVNTITVEEALNDSRTSKRKSSIKNSTYEKIENKSINLNTTFEKETPSEEIHESKKARKYRSSRISLENNYIPKVLNGTYDKNVENTSVLNGTFDKPKLDTTFECSDGKKYVKSRSTSSMISSDATNILSEDCSRISITSDDSESEHIINTTPVLIESSMDDSEMNSSKISKTITPPKDELAESTTTPHESFFGENKETPLKRDGTYTDLRKTPSKRRETSAEESKPEADYSKPTTPLKREGTFTKDGPTMSPKIASDTPPRRKSMPSPGRTPFPSSRSRSKEPGALNVTHSIEKPQRRSSAAAAAPRLTRVMFCSPVDNPAAAALIKGKVIKSNLKGSNKSFVFDDSVRESGSVARKRSRTQGCEPGAVKRARLTGGGAPGRARTASAAARLQEPRSPKREPTPSKAKPARTRLPNFTALHQKNFEKMESLDECQERKAKRAKQLLTPTAGAPADTTSPRETTDAVEQTKKPETPKLKDAEKKAQMYTKFGFKLNLDVNPFSIPPKTTIKPTDNIIKQGLNRQATLPSLAGTTLRKEVAKQAIMRNKSFTDKRNLTRTENRTIIKGVRTNRRFELQMKMRNVN